MAGRKAPRYDIPNAAPEPLRRVQLFVNTVNCESGEDWLDTWLEGEGVKAPAADLDRARVVREAFRELLHANNLHEIEGDPWPVLTAAADAAQFSIDFSRPQLVARAPGVDGAVGQMLAMVYAAMADGSFERLKCCRNDHCRWAFYDYSKNRSASWCSMQLCGNRRKTSAYRARRTRA